MSKQIWCDAHEEYMNEHFDINGTHQEQELVSIEADKYADDAFERLQEQADIQRKAMRGG